MNMAVSDDPVPVVPKMILKLEEQQRNSIKFCVMLEKTPIDDRDNTDQYIFFNKHMVVMPWIGVMCTHGIPDLDLDSKKQQMMPAQKQESSPVHKWYLSVPPRQCTTTCTHFYISIRCICRHESRYFWSIHRLSSLWFLPVLWKEESSMWKCVWI